MGWDVDTRYVLAYLVSWSFCLCISVCHLLIYHLLAWTFLSWLHLEFDSFIDFVFCNSDRKWEWQSENRDGKRDENITADIEDRCVRDMYVCMYVCT